MSIPVAAPSYTPPVCGAPKADGSTCRSPIGLSPVNGRCAVHDPERADAVAANRRRGGRKAVESRREAKAKDIPTNLPVEPTTLEDATRFAAWLSRAVLAKDIDARTCEAATKAIRQFELGKKSTSLEDEVKKLRAELADARRERPRA